MGDYIRYDHYGDNTLDPETVREARLLVCSHAEDVEDALDLLSVLGLSPTQAEKDEARVVVPLRRRKPA